MTTVSDLIADLNAFDGSLTVNGAETLTVSTVTNVPVVPVPAPTPEPTPDEVPA